MYSQQAIGVELFTDMATSALKPGSSAYTTAEVVDVCSNLVVTRNEVFEFAHLSVREFLEGLPKRNIDTFLPNKGNARIAAACLQYVSNRIDAVDAMSVAGLPAFAKPQVAQQDPPPDIEKAEDFRIVLQRIHREVNRISGTRHGQRPGVHNRIHAENMGVFDLNGNTRPLDDWNQKSTIRHYPFWYWIHHVSKSNDARKTQPLAGLIRSFLLSDSPARASQRFEIWCRMPNFDFPDFKDKIKINDIRAIPDNPIWVACLCGWLDVVDYLYAAKYKHIGRPERLGSLSGLKSAYAVREATPLWYAWLSNNTPMMDCIFRHCTDTLEGKIEGEEVPLVQAAMLGDQEFLAILLGKKHGGLYVEARALLYAAGNGHCKILEMLVNYNGQVLSKAGHMSMRKASRAGHMDAVTFFLDRGVPGSADRETTLLSDTTHNQQTDSMSLKLLLKRAVKLGRIPKAVVKSVSNSDDSHSTLPPEQKMPQFFMEKTKYSKAGDAPLLIKSTLDAEIGTMERWPLHYAAEFHNSDAVCSHLRAGVPVNAYDPYGDTPLHTAVARGNYACVEVLLDHGASVLAEDRNSRIALDLAETKKYKEIAAVIRGRMLDLLDELQIAREIQTTLDSTGEDTDVTEGSHVAA